MTPGEGVFWKVKNTFVKAFKRNEPEEVAEEEEEPKVERKIHSWSPGDVAPTKEDSLAHGHSPPLASIREAHLEEAGAPEQPAAPSSGIASEATNEPLPAAPGNGALDQTTRYTSWTDVAPCFVVGVQPGAIPGMQPGLAPMMCYGGYPPSTPSFIPGQQGGSFRQMAQQLDLYAMQQRHLAEQYLEYAQQLRNAAAAAEETQAQAQHFRDAYSLTANRDVEEVRQETRRRTSSQGDGSATVIYA